MYLRNIGHNFWHVEDHVIGGFILHDLSIETGLQVQDCRIRDLFCRYDTWTEWAKPILLEVSCEVHLGH